jgi:hypothetical protein
MSEYPIKDLTPKNKVELEVDPRLFKVPFNMIVYGKSASGKTNFLLNLIEPYKKIFKNRMIVFTASIDNTWKKPLEDTNGILYRSLYSDTKKVCIIEEIMKFQKKELDEVGMANMKHVLIILDDFLDDPIMAKRSSVITKLFRCARHYHISIILTSQGYTSIQKSIRCLSWNDIIFKPSAPELEQMTIEKCGMIDVSKDQFKEIIRSITEEPYSFAKLDNRKFKIYKRLSNDAFDFSSFLG